jgi:hypothetical protein
LNKNLRARICPIAEALTPIDDSAGSNPARVVRLSRIASSSFFGDVLNDDENDVALGKAACAGLAHDYFF